jgi:hypothetical protein
VVVDRYIGYQKLSLAVKKKVGIAVTGGAHFLVVC